MTSSFASATIDSRQGLGTQFFYAAAMFAEQALGLECLTPHGTLAPMLLPRYCALVSSAVMQSSAAAEAEISEILMHGLGSPFIASGRTALAILEPLADMIDKQSVVHRYQTVLHLLSKQQFDGGAEPYQSMALLVKLRNEVTHYKSYWSSKLDSKNIFVKLERQRFAGPWFVPESVPFFPQRCLVAQRAVWAVNTTQAFLIEFYKRLGVPCPAGYTTVRLPAPANKPNRTKP